jgi:hypothetical protein
MQVHRRSGKPGRSVRAELVEEPLEGGARLALADPHDHAVAVVVGDHGQVAVALSVGDLVDADLVSSSMR